MSHYLNILEISASGMQAERLRLEVSALNLANAQSVRAPGAAVYRAQRVVTSPAGETQGFAGVMAGEAAALAGVTTQVLESESSPRRVHQPDHPYADAEGFIEMPAVDPALEMSGIMGAVRAYEANVKVVNAARAMLTRALEIGERG